MNKQKFTSLTVLMSSVLLLQGNATASQKIEAVTKETPIATVNHDLSEAIKEWKAKFKLPSLVVAVNIQGETVFNQAVGLADIESGKAATVETPYSVGSIAKSMTSLAMARLIDQGRLSLHSPISDYGDYQQNWQSLTSYQLASHTAGIVHFNDARNEREFEQVRDHWRPSQAFDVFSKDQLKFSAGSSFSYSSSGYILLSDVIAQVAETPYLQLMRQEVFAPLNMHHTLFDSKAANAQTEASYYAPLKTKDGIHQRSTDKRDRSFLFGGGGYQSTAKDLVNMVWNMSQNNYLQEQTLAQLMTPVKLQNGETNGQNYGLGWRIHDMDVSQYIPGKEQQIIQGVHHGGTTSNAANAYVLTFPEHGVSISYTTNSIPSSVNSGDNLQVQMWLWLYRYLEAAAQA